MNIPRQLQWNARKQPIQASAPALMSRARARGCAAIALHITCAMRNFLHAALMRWLKKLTTGA